MHNQCLTLCQTCGSPGIKQNEALFRKYYSAVLRKLVAICANKGVISDGYNSKLGCEYSPWYVTLNHNATINLHCSNKRMNRWLLCELALRQC